MLAAFIFYGKLEERLKKKRKKTMVTKRREIK